MLDEWVLDLWQEIPDTQHTVFLLVQREYDGMIHNAQTIDLPVLGVLLQNKLNLPQTESQLRAIRYNLRHISSELNELQAIEFAERGREYPVEFEWRGFPYPLSF